MIGVFNRITFCAAKAPSNWAIFTYKSHKIWVFGIDFQPILA